ncbi:MAG: RNA 2',3'-cyclic phosphodiesterase, partial [Proteobacteria bacterium]|nr:RNA 2',3'-cyclic phosphodiesterase [Pseudomonadota bacterium]
MRCFVGLPLPESWQAGLARVTVRLSAALASPVRWTRPGNWHLTLKFLGDVEEACVPDLVRALSAVAFAPFALRPGRAGFFPPLGQ